MVEGFPASSAVKNPPASAGNMGLIPVWEDPTRRATKTVCCVTTGLGSRAHEPQLPSPQATATSPQAPRPCFTRREATAVSPHTTTKGNPRSPQLERSPHGSEDPAQPVVEQTATEFHHNRLFWGVDFSHLQNGAGVNLQDLPHQPALLQRAVRSAPSQTGSPQSELCYRCES